MQVVTTSSSLLRRFPVSFKPHKKPRRLQLLTCELDNAVAATAATRIISENANQNQNENTLQRDALLMIAYMKNTRSQSQIRRVSQSLKKILLHRLLQNF